MVIFNNKSIPEFVKVRKVDIQTLAEISTNTKSLSGQYGKISGKSSFGSKIISIDIAIVIPNGSTLQRCARELAGWLKGDNFKLSSLIINDDPTIQYKAKVNNSVNLNDLLFAGDGTIEFVIPSGLAEDIMVKKITGTDVVSLDNTGTFTVLPEIKVVLNQAVTNGTVLISNSLGDKIILHGNFKVGDIIDINCSKYLIKVNNKITLDIIGLETVFFELKEGKHEIRCSIPSKLEVNFQRRWL